jgi:hypothetical protein
MRAHLVSAELFRLSGHERFKSLRYFSSGLRHWRVLMRVRATERQSGCTDWGCTASSKDRALVCALLLRCGQTERKAVLGVWTKGERLL